METGAGDHRRHPRPLVPSCGGEPVSDTVLPDLLRPGLDLVICGTAASHESRRARAYYAHPSNRFWPVLAETGLTPRLLAPEEFRLLPEFGIGLTDLAKHASGRDLDLCDEDFDVSGFRKRIVAAQPRILVFNGKTAAARYFGTTTQKLAYGRYGEQIGRTVLCIARSTSGGNAHWNPDSWHGCAGLVREIARHRKKIYDAAKGFRLS